MRTGPKITTLSLLLCAAIFASTAEAAPKRSLLRDGFVMSGMDGRLIDDNDCWYFMTAADANDGMAVLPAGSRLQLLPSATLAKITLDSKLRNSRKYRIWARVTKYEGRNYLFPVYYLPLSRTAMVRPQPADSESKPQEKPPADANDGQVMPAEQLAVSVDPNDIIGIPPEVVEKLKASRSAIPKLAEPATEPNSEPNAPAVIDHTVEDPNRARVPKFEQDRVLASRTGFIRGVSPGAFEDHEAIFLLDALGLGIQQKTYRLLPCEALKLTQWRQHIDPGRTRFKIAGIVTEYKGNEYLLLQQAVRVYSYGNFGR